MRERERGEREREGGREGERESYTHLVNDIPLGIKRDSLLNVNIKQARE